MFKINLNLSENLVNSIIQWITQHVKEGNMIGWILIFLIIILALITYRAVRVIQRQMMMIQMQEQQIKILKEIKDDYKNFIAEIGQKLNTIIDKSYDLKYEFESVLDKKQELDKKLIEKETLINAYLMKNKK